MVALLEKHRENLSAASTFEEYKAAHIKYVDALIEIQRADKKKQEVRDRFVGAVAMAWRQKVVDHQSDGASSEAVSATDGPHA